eukprot:TRINITY_DN20920_c0_g1_i1.p1 TRINITY_DN20920_c0_g1~~TRINITY_DN20920_c0_g1_i1.p1  ORF type:complete len:157 (+),score=54.07 TRINITY_DN20920_c0_g1_i1:85-555(+)
MEMITNITNLTEIANSTELIIEGYHEEKNRQLLIILAIIISVFSASALILIAYMVIFPSRIEEESSDRQKPFQDDHSKTSGMQAFTLTALLKDSKDQSKNPSVRLPPITPIHPLPSPSSPSQQPALLVSSPNRTSHWSGSSLTDSSQDQQVEVASI